MILAAGIEEPKKKRIYIGTGHIYARQAACKQESIQPVQTFGFHEGFVSDKCSYTTISGDVYKGHFRNRRQAFVEAQECNQLAPGAKPRDIVIDGVDLGGLDSSQVNLTEQELTRAQALVDQMNANFDMITWQTESQCECHQM
ncbi:MAG: hypothetical protein LBG88_00330 [Christensenellaceae bacterium]|jgi:hypothetical protein|nr:hypothetical protein [Christensenellaceae bacterium]